MADYMRECLIHPSFVRLTSNICLAVLDHIKHTLLMHDIKVGHSVLVGISPIIPKLVT